MATQIRAAYSPVNQAWLVIFGRTGAPIEQWSVISVGGWKIWPGKKEGRRMLESEMARLGLRFAPDDPNQIIAENENADE